jgi:RNA polymerase primary sigma factor
MIPDDDTWTLVCEHRPLVPRVVAKFRNAGVSPSDLRAEGILGLVEAALRFDPAQGVPFGAYAFHWVRKRVREAVLRDLTIVQISKYHALRLARIRDAARDLEGELGREPNSEELARRVGLDPRTVRETLAGVPRPAFLDAPVGPGSDLRLVDTIAQTTEPSPEDAAEKASVLRFLRERIDSLPPRERGVLRLHFGLDGAEPRPLAAIARRYGVSRERIHQIEQTALRRLRRWIDRPSPLPPP